MTDCSFKFFEKSTICDHSSTHILFSNLNQDDQHIFQSDVGVFWGHSVSKNYKICPAHIKLFGNKHKARLRRYACNIPAFFQAEHDHQQQKNRNKLGSSVKGDRKINLSQMHQIYQSHGVVIPIGTCKFKVLQIHIFDVSH